NGSLVFHSGCCVASCLMRSKANKAWKNIGCSAQSVPSLSNSAMRSAIGTSSGETGLVTVATNSTIDRLALPSFRAGSRPTADVALACSDGRLINVLLSGLAPSAGTPRTPSQPTDNTDSPTRAGAGPGAVKTGPHRAVRCDRVGAEEEAVT